VSAEVLTALFCLAYTRQARWLDSVVAVYTATMHSKVLSLLAVSSLVVLPDLHWQPLALMHTRLRKYEGGKVK
jgi:hypothetical protein